jgi:flagellar biogenesis protein FliO
MDRTPPSRLRMFGMMGNMLALLILVGYAIFIVYRHPPAI